VFLGGNGSYNYYHFLVELAPKLLYLEMLEDSIPVLVPPAVERVAQFRELLELLAPSRRFVVMRDDRMYACQKLHYLTAPTLMPINLREDCLPQASDLYIDKASLLEVRRKALHHYRRDAEGAQGTRLFLTRQTDYRRYNQDQLVDAASQFGFVSIDLGSLSLAEQVRQFWGADFIIGPTGAAWTNLLFARPGAAALYWIWEEYQDFAPWAALGDPVGGRCELPHLRARHRGWARPPLLGLPHRSGSTG